MSPFSASLQTASFRGFMFHVRGLLTDQGRRTAVHEYPYRDEVYVEDLGKMARQVTISGYLSAIDGVYPIHELAAVMEEEDAGVLVHPAFGSITCKVRRFQNELSVDAAGLIQFTATFLEDGGQRGPVSIGAGIDSILSAADALDASSIGAFATSAGNLIRTTTGAVSGIIATGQRYMGEVTGVVRSVTSVASSVTGIASAAGISLGRFASGSRLLNRPLSSVTGIINTQQGAIARASNAARGVEKLIGVAKRLGSSL